MVYCCFSYLKLDGIFLAICFTKKHTWGKSITVHFGCLSTKCVIKVVRFAFFSIQLIKWGERESINETHFLAHSGNKFMEKYIQIKIYFNLITTFLYLRYQWNNVRTVAFLFRFVWKSANIRNYLDRFAPSYSFWWQLVSLGWLYNSNNTFRKIVSLSIDIDIVWSCGCQVHLMFLNECL